MYRLCDDHRVRNKAGIMSKNNEKYNEILKEFYEKIPFENRSHYEELASKAIALGYYPIRDKTKCLSISFRNKSVLYISK